MLKRQDSFQFKAAYWGLLPAYKILEERSEFLRKTNTLNARAEGLLESALYQEPFRDQRCIIIADGFFENHHAAGEVFPYFIRYKDYGLMAMAGIYTELDDGTFTVSMITTKANPFFASIHNKKNKHGEFRMPLIFDPPEMMDWLDDNVPQAEIMELLFRFTSKPFDAFTVSKDVNNSRKPSNHAQIIEPVYYPQLQTLF